MRQRSKWAGACTGVLGVLLALAPLTAAASAATHRPKHQTTSTDTKGSNPGSAMCKDVKNEQASTGASGSAIEKAMTSGNFPAAKQALLKAYNADLANVNKALGVIKNAPPNVRAAFKGLLGAEQQFRNDIESASSLQAMIASFATLGKNAELESDGTTIANWYTSVCGGALSTATTVSVP